MNKSSKKKHGIVEKCLNVNVESLWIIFMSSPQNFFVINHGQFHVTEEKHAGSTFSPCCHQLFFSISYKYFPTTSLSLYLTVSSPYLYLRFCPQRYQRRLFKSPLTHIYTTSLDYQSTIISKTFILERFLSWANMCWVPGVSSSSSSRLSLTILWARA